MSSEQRIEVLGIRHHGPGSARSVARALADLQPDAVVIEGPPELDKVAHLAGLTGMKPPVAALVYSPTDPRLSSFYPMATFSPEWVALRWALDNDIPVQFADLPATNQLAARVEPSPTEESPVGDDSDTEGEPHDDPEPDEPSPVPDAIGALAGAAGYTDSERWWEDAIEQRFGASQPLEQFDAVREAIALFRDGVEDDRRTLQREAAMRKVLRAVRKEGHERIAVICGAYHAPVLHPDAWPPATRDTALLKGLPKTKVQATWSPWTSSRLALSSGYGAGVSSPGWYHHLFVTEQDVTARWMVRVAGCLRAEGFDASSASVVEATRLADALAVVRGRPLAGLSELNDASLAVLTGGSATPLDMVHEELIVGTNLGSVPPETPMVPLARDLEKQQKSVRLKPSAAEKTITLDLRRDSQLARSVLLHRLRMLGVHWGIQVDAGRSTGTFKEAWTIEWQPEFAVAIIDANSYGNTIQSAAVAKVAETARDSTDLASLCELVEQCLTAELPDALVQVLATLEEQTASTHDTRTLAEAVDPLARTQRYGDVRGVDTSAVSAVLDVLVARTSIGVSGACSGLDDDAAALMRRAIEGVERGVQLVSVESLSAQWNEAIDRLAERRDGHGSIIGRVNRIALEGGRIDRDEAAKRLSRALSRSSEASDAAAWLDGFLAGDALLLIHDPQLLSLIHQWLSGLVPETFDALLPLIRRTFSNYEAAERRLIGERVRQLANGTEASTELGPIDSDQARPAVLKVAELLGLQPSGSAP